MQQLEGIENDLLQAFLEHIPDHVYFKDLASRFLRISHSLATLFGLSDAFNSLAETLAYIKVVDGLRAKAAIATAGFAGLTVSELQGLDWKDFYDGQWHVERKVVEGRTGEDGSEAGRRTDHSVPAKDH